MPYGDWEPSFQEIFDNIPGMGEPDTDIGYAETLFETAFTYDAAELDAMGYDPDDIDAIRDAFFDYMGIDDSDFDWDSWREAMGYELPAPWPAPCLEAKTMSVVEWLESPEGEKWSREQHAGTSVILVSIKDDEFFHAWDLIW